MGTINQSPPTEIIGMVVRSDTVKSAHSLFEPTIAGIDVLNVVGPGDNPNICGQIGQSAIPISRVARPSCHSLVLALTFKEKGFVRFGNTKHSYRQ